MARRKKRRAAAASAAPSTAGIDGWANLPDLLLFSVLDRLHSVADIFAVSAVCRSWRVLSWPSTSSAAAGVRARCPPLLLNPSLGAVEPGRGRFLSPADRATASHRCLVSPTTLAAIFVGYSFGHMIFRRDRSVLIADAVTGDECRPPKLPQSGQACYYGILTAPLSTPGCSLLFHDSGMRPVIFRWRVGDRKWSAHPLGEEYGFMNSLSVFKGQILGRCGFDPFGGMVLVKLSPDLSVAARLALPWLEGESSRLPVDPFASATFFSRHLVDCGDELMLVCFLWLSEWKFKVEVYRFDLSSAGPALVKVESLGDRAVFVDTRGSTSASCANPGEWGGRSNCIYVAGWEPDTWTVLPLDHELRDGGPGSPFSVENFSAPTGRLRPLWVYPSILY